MCRIGANSEIPSDTIIGNNVIVGENCVIGETPSVWDASPDDERFDKKLFIGDGHSHTSKNVELCINNTAQNAKLQGEILISCDFSASLFDSLHALLLVTRE